MEPPQQDGGSSSSSFKLLVRNFLGTIAGGLTSLAALPFGNKRKKEQDDDAFLDPTPGDKTGQDLSKLYPDAELSETRKRARLFVEGSPQDQGECSMACAEKADEDSHLENVLNLADIGVHRTVDVTQPGSSSVAEHQGVCDLTPETLLVVNEALDGRVPCIDEIPVDEEAPDQVLEDFDENLASFKRTLMARKAKQQKRGQAPINEESPRKRVRFGAFPSGLSSDSQMSHEHPSKEDVGSNNRKQKRSVEFEHENEKKLRALTMRKRKRDVGVKDKSERKLRVLTISDKPVRIKENKHLTTRTVGLKRKADGGPAATAVVIDEMKLKTSIMIEDKATNKQFSKYGTVDSMQSRSALPFDEKASKKKQRKNIPNSQTSEAMYKDRGPTNTTVWESMKKPSLGKRLRSSSPEQITFENKRAKLGFPGDNVMATDAAPQTRITRSHKLDVNQLLETMVPSRNDLHAMRRIDGSGQQTPVPNDSVEAKRKRVEKRQRGISRSKKIRRA